MPNYEYQCSNEECAYHETVLNKQHLMKDCDLEHLCPICTSKKIKSTMNRLISGFSALTGNKPETIKIKT